MKNKFVKQFSGVSFFQLINSISFFILNILAAKYLGPKLFGNYYFFVSTSIISTLLFDFGLSRTLLRYSAFHEARGEVAQKLGYYASVLKVKIILGITILVAAVGLIVIFGDELRTELILGMVVGFVVSFSQYLSAVAQTEENYTDYNIIMSFNTFRLVLFLGLIFLGLMQVNTLYAVFIVAPLLLLLFPSIRLGRDLISANAVSEHHFYSKIIKFGKWMMMLSVLETLHQRLDVILVRVLTNDVQAGYYSGALSFFGIVYMLPAFLSILIYPHFVKAISRNDVQDLARQYKLSTNLLAVMAMPIALGLWAVSPDLIDLFLGEKYAASEMLFKYLAIYSLLLGCHMNSGALFFAKDKPQYVVLIVAIVLLTNLTGNLVLIPLLGILGAAISIAVAAAVSMLVSWALIKKHFNMLPNLGQLVGLLLIGCMMAVTVRIMPSGNWYLFAAKLSIGGLIFIGGVLIMNKLSGNNRFLQQLMSRGEN